MSKPRITTEELSKLQSLKLSDSARARVRGELAAYADMHGVREVEASRSSEQVSQASAWYTALFTNRIAMPFIAVAVAVVLGGGTTFAAQSSLPGETLYPVKLHVNENVRSAFAIGADAEATLQAELLATRVAEAQDLEAEGRLTGELAAATEARIAAQAEAADRANDDASDETLLATDNTIRLALSNYAEVGGSGLLAARSASEESAEESADAADSTSMSMSADADTATMLALEPIELKALITNTDARIEGLVEVLADHKSEIDASAYAKYTATLETAAELMVEVKAESSEAEARRIVLEVADLAGQVESSLSLMGTVTIDEETGAIIDIDLSTPPPSDLGRPVEIDTNAQGAVNVDISDDMIEGDAAAGLEATSGLSL